MREKEMTQFGEIGRTVLENADDEELVRRLFTSDHIAIETCATGYRYEGIEDVVHREFGRWTTAFPDLAIEVQHVATSGDLEMVEAIGTGTHQGLFDLGQELEPTGRSMHLPFVSVYRIRDGRASHSRHYWDDAVIMNQLGVLELKRPRIGPLALS
jgi:ketosteroid isomerase-like protein